MKYIERLLLDEIKRWIKRREILAIKGPRQSGKTTLLTILSDWLKIEMKVNEKHIVYVTFEDREQLDNFYQNPKDFVDRYVSDDDTYYFLIDEAQYCQDLGQKLKLVYDLFKNTKLIITGSSSLELKNRTGKFLVGRIFEFELFPLNFYEFLNYKDPGLAKSYKVLKDKFDSALSGRSDGFEIKKDKDILLKDILHYLNEFVTFGGFPAVVSAEDSEEKIAILKNLTNTYIDKDIASFLQISDTIRFRKFITAIAASNGGMLKLERLAGEVGSYFKETSKLLDDLEQTYIIRRISPYHRNLVTELKKEQKVYFVDTGLRNSLIANFSNLDQRPDAGVLVENFVLNEIAPRSRLHFWRTTAKTEVDFVVENKKLTPIEVKFQHLSDATGSRSLYGFLNEYGSKSCFVLTKDFWGERLFNGSKILFMPVVYV
jgi:predicted AAA+ superfamily ATPase